MKLIVGKRQEGKSTELIRQWRETGGLLIASSEVIGLVKGEPGHHDCLYATYTQAYKSHFLSGCAINYVYIDDVDIFLHGIFNTLTFSSLKIIGTICEDHLEPLKKTNTRQDDVCTAYLCPECGAVIDHVEKRTLVTNTRIERVDL